MTEIFPLPQISEFINELRKNMFIIGKNRILDPLGILHILQNF